MKCGFRVLFGVVVLAFLPVIAAPWQSHEHKFSFDVPNTGWKDMGTARQGIFREGVVEFASTNGSFFTVSCFPYRVDEDFKVDKAYNTSQTTLSMLKALANPVWHIGEEGVCRVNGVPGYQFEVSYYYEDQVHFAFIIVLAKNNTHYRLVYTWPGDIYLTGYLDFQRIIASFRITD